MNNKVFRCAICGKEYTSVEDRAKCELKCTEERIKAEAKKKAEAEMAEKKRRKMAVDHAFAKAYDLAYKYIEDYNCYEYEDEDIMICDPEHCSHCKSGCECPTEPFSLSTLYDALRMMP